MFPLMNKRQHQALVQSALRKIHLYQRKQLIEQQTQLLAQANANVIREPISIEPKPLRREHWKKKRVTSETKTVCKDGGSLSVCTFLIKNKDFNCVAHDNSYIVNQDCANGLLSVNHKEFIKCEIDNSCADSVNVHPEEESVCLVIEDEHDTITELVKTETEEDDEAKENEEESDITNELSATKQELQEEIDRQEEIKNELVNETEKIRNEIIEEVTLQIEEDEE